MRSALIRTALGIAAIVGIVFVTVQPPHVEIPATSRSTTRVMEAQQPTPAHAPAVNARNAVAPSGGAPHAEAEPTLTPPIRRENAVASPYTRPAAEASSPAADKLDSALKAAVSGDATVRYRVIVQSGTGRLPETRDRLSQAGASVPASMRLTAVSSPT